MSSDLVLLIKFGAFTVFAVWMAIIADLLIFQQHYDRIIKIKQLGYSAYPHDY